MPSIHRSDCDFTGPLMKTTEISVTKRKLKLVLSGVLSFHA